MVQAIRSWAISEISSQTRVHGVVAERELVHAGVLAGLDAVLDARVAAVARLQVGDVGVGLVGQDRLEAVPVVVGEGQLRAGVRALAAHDHARPGRPAGQVQAVGDLGDPGAVVVARLAVLA